MDLSVICDGEWHWMLIDLSENPAYTPNSNGEYIFLSGDSIRMDFTKTNPEIMTGLIIAHMYMYDDVNRIPDYITEEN
jgi:hypothetical protein